MNTDTYAFGRYALHAARRELFRDGQPVALSTSAIDLLAYLIVHADRAVGRDELGAAVWGRTDVSDTVLSQTVLKARRAIGDDGQQQALIQTVPRLGYRWVGALSSVAAEAPPAQPAAVPDQTHADASPDNVQAAAGAPAPAPAGTDARPPVARRRWVLSAAAALAGAVLVLAAVLPLQPVTSAVAGQTAQQAVGTAVLVLPVEVDADPGWAWLRIGGMELIASRLREAGVESLPAETVLAAVGAGEAARAELERAATRVYRSGAVLRDGLWRVRIDSATPGESLQVEAEHGDAVVAATRAADLLLVRLGQAPPPARSGALEELLHRSRAAMLSNQMELARELLDAAPPGVRERPEVLHRRAQVALRSGDYPAVEAIVGEALASPLLDAETTLQARLLVTLAAAELRQRRVPQARARYAEAAALLDEGTDPHTRGTALLGEGAALAAAGDLDAAALQLGLARAELERVGDTLGTGQVDLNLAQVARLHQRPADAVPALERARSRFLALGAYEEAAFATISLAEARSELLQHAEALALLDALGTPALPVANARMAWQARVVRASVLLRLDRRAEAAAVLAEVEAGSDPVLDAELRRKAGLLAMTLAARQGRFDTVEAALGAVPLEAVTRRDACAFAEAHAARLRLLAAPGSPAPAGAPADALSALEDWSRSWEALACVRIPVALARLAAEGTASADGWPHRRAGYLDVLADAERVGIPELLVEAASQATAAAAAAGDLDTAHALAGRVSAWRAMDPRADLAPELLAACAPLQNGARSDNECRTKGNPPTVAYARPLSWTRAPAPVPKAGDARCPEAGC